MSPRTRLLDWIPACAGMTMNYDGRMEPSPSIRIAAALLVRADGRTLLVRKRGTRAFMQPGGKIEQGEAPAEALALELRE